MTKTGLIYKYRTFDNEGYNLRTLSHQEIYFAHPEQLNDEFDLRIIPAYEKASKEEILNAYRKYIYEDTCIDDATKEEIECEIVQMVNENPKILIDKVRDNWRNIGSALGVCSFSKDSCKIPTMWAHYGENYKGFCIGFDQIELLKFIRKYKSETITPYDVTYVDEIPRLNPFTNAENLEPYEVFLTYKTSQWASEEEFRLIMTDVTDVTNRVLRIPKKCIKEVILGYKIDEDDRRKIIDILSSWKKNPKLYIINPNVEIPDYSLNEVNY